MLHYFTQLPKDYDLTFEKNISVSKAIMHTAKNAFIPFYQYLDTTIKALDKKEDIKATWTKVKEDNLVELKIIGSLFEVPKTTKIKLLNIEKGLYKIKNNIDEDDFDFSEKIKYKAGKEKNELTISKDNIKNGFIKLPVEFDKFDKVIWGFETLDLEPAWITVSQNNKIIQNNTQFKILSINNDIIEVEGILNNSQIFINNKQVNFEIIEISKQPQNTKLIKEEKNRFIVYSEKKGKHQIKLQNLLNKENIKFEDGTKFNAEHSDNLIFKIKDKSIIGKKVICDNVKFEIKELRNNDKNQYWIQLHEIDEEKEDIPGFSPLKYFFDDDIDIYSEKDNHLKFGKREKYSIAIGNESEYKLVLKHKVEKKDYKTGKKYFAFESCFPPENYNLQVKVNTYQLKKQLEVVLTLQNMPVREHSNLIKLFEKREVVKWYKPTNEYIDEWIVLTDENRSGSFEQREFVEKALSTPDFAILEGPPGSGKTTVILELICQLAKQGKHVLLCGSTHVAIDNVLERLKEKDNNQTNLIEKYNILPVRIGDENRINEDIKEFQIDNLQKEHNISENLLLDAANLVCGTTIGILQHPKFKSRKSYNRKHPTFKEPIVPEFDYLIIDESSKTTFQEFLVPGLYAKKWILAGDVMQLSPFTDREQIVTNLETLQLKNGKPLPEEYQRATFYLHKLLEITKYARNKFILPVSSKVIKPLYDEIIKRKQNIIISFFDAKTYNRLELTASDIIIIDKNILDKYIDKLPETHAILRSESWQTSQHSFIHNNWQQKGNSFKLRVRKNELESSFEIVDNTNTYFKDKSWAEEIAWRIDREHQLRLLGESKTRSYKKTIEELIPLSLDKEDIENRINNLASIAFPSILESLITGIKGRKSSNRTTISEGFPEKELKTRRTILKYQHRMHPEISKFPREQFYKRNALLDLEKPKPIAEMRQWDYNEYARRSIWINVNGKTVKNYNKDEVNILISELEKFIGFASKNEQPEKKEWTVACLTFYKGQETKIRERLQKLTGKESAFSNFNIERNGKKINIKLHTVDKFQGHEADIVFLSMVQTFRDGFMDNPNRLNVAITRAKFQLVIIGDYLYFAQKSRSEDLKQLALNTQIHK